MRHLLKLTRWPSPRGPLGPGPQVLTGSRNGCTGLHYGLAAISGRFYRRLSVSVLVDVFWERGCAFGGDSAAPKRFRYKLRLPRRSAGGCNLRLRLLDRNAAVGNSDRGAQRLDADADDAAGCSSFLPGWHLDLWESPGSSVGPFRPGCACTSGRIPYDVNSLGNGIIAGGFNSDRRCNTR
jgi:hypothetical protein